MIGNSLLDKSQGLLKEEAQSWSTDAVTHDGKYLWGDLGLTIINQIKASNDSEATYITGLNVMGQPQYFTGSSDTIHSGHSKFKWNDVSGPYNMPVNLSLPHNEQLFAISFCPGKFKEGRTLPSILIFFKALIKTGALLQPILLLKII